MGNCWHSCRTGRKASKRKIVLLLVGLDNAGKTTAAKSLIGEPQDGIVPTVGFSAITLNYRHWSVTIYDVGGGQQIRGIWPQYFVDVHGIIFVVDASDISRLEEGQKVLEQLLGHEKLSGKPMLLLANKQDCKEALDELDIVEQLNVEALVNFHHSPTLVETCSALRSKSSQKKVDPAIHSGFKWLINCISEDYEQLNRRVETDTREQRILEEQIRQERLKRIHKAREEREEEAVPYQSNAEEDSDSGDVVTSDPFRPINEVMYSLDGIRKAVVEPALSDRIILVKESPGKDGEKNESFTLQEQVSSLVPKHGGSRDSTTENVIQMVKDQLQLDAVSHRRHIPLLPHRNNRTAPAPVFENVSLNDIAAIEAAFEINEEVGTECRKADFIEKNCSPKKTNLKCQYSFSKTDTVEQNANRKHSGDLIEELPPTTCNTTVNTSKALCVSLDASVVGENKKNIEAIKHECISLPVTRKRVEQEKQGSTRRVVNAEVPHCNKLERSTVLSGKSSIDESSLSNDSKSILNDSGFTSPWKILPPLRPPSSGDKPQWNCPTLSSIPQRSSSSGSEVVAERRDHISSLDKSIIATNN